MKGAAAFGLILLALIVLMDESTTLCALPMLIAGFFLLRSSQAQKSKTQQQSLSGRGSDRIRHAPTESGAMSTRRSKSSKIPNPSVTVQVSHASPESWFVEEARKHVKRRGRRTEHIYFKSYWPTYSDMNAVQQAWYFYWRDEVRNHRYPDTSLSYIFLHIYELLNNVGVANADDGYHQLRRLWLNYRERYPELDGYLASWIIDYLVVNHATVQPLDVYKDHELHSALVQSTPDLVLHAFLEGSAPLHTMPLFLLDVLTDYRIQRSKFYLSGYDKVLQQTLGMVLEAIDVHMRKQYGKGIFEKYCPKTREPVTAGSFESAIYNDSSRTVTVAQIYSYSRHEPLRQFLTTVVKHTENMLRQQYSFAGRLKVPPLNRSIAEVIEETISSQTTALVEAAEFEIEEPPKSRKGVPVPIPPPSQIYTPPRGALQVVSSQYLEQARKVSARKGSIREPVSLESPFTGFSYDFQNLSTPQAEWYFYWRAQVRRGQYLATDLAYIFIHAPELIHLIGVRDANDAFRQLRALWLNYREVYPQIDPYLLGWILSFITVHDAGVMPRDVLLEPAAYDFTLRTAPDVLLQEYCDGPLDRIPLNLLNQYIDHDILQSSFYTAGYSDLMERIIPAVVNIVNEHHVQNGKGSLFKQFRPHYLTIEVKQCWRAARTYGNWPTRIVLKDVPAYSQHDLLRRTLTAIVKYTENRLREEKSHRGRLRVSDLDGETGALIDRVLDQNRNTISPPPPVHRVEIDLSQVEMLRAESEQVLEILKVDEVREMETSVTQELTVEEVEDATEETLPASFDPVPDPEIEDDNMWAKMAAALDDHQLEVLAAILDGGDAEATLHRVANANFLMPTMLVDGINELAQDTIGDILIDMTPTLQLIDDYYRPHLQRIVAMHDRQHR